MTDQQRARLEHGLRAHGFPNANLQPLRGTASHESLTRVTVGSVRRAQEQAADRGRLVRYFDNAPLRIVG